MIVVCFADENEIVWYVNYAFGYVFCSNVKYVVDWIIYIVVW